MARLAAHDAQQKNFVTSFVVVSDNDLHFHRFDDVYRKVVGELSTNTCPRGALGDILDRWIANVEDMLVDGGADPNAPGFDAAVAERIKAELVSRTGGAVPADFVRVVQAIFEAKQEGDLTSAGALLSWLSGSSNVSTQATRRGDVKGVIGGRAAMDYLHGIVQIVKMAGYAGLVIVIDEAETMLRMRKDVRSKSMNGIRQILDMAGKYKGLLWIFTGTDEFFESRRGVAGLEPLADRIRLQEVDGFVSRRQAQLVLRRFDEKRLREVAIKLRDLYPTGVPNRIQAQIDDRFIEALVRSVTAGFGGDVGIVPRHFLRALVTRMDTVDEHPDYRPSEALSVEGVAVDPEDVARARGALPREDDDDTPIAKEEVW
jgi:hypothetical protein